jgi:acetyl-CoA C-acetyltransferase
MSPPVAGLPPRTPVLVGVGTETSSAPLTELLAAAALAAGEDCGIPTLLGATERIHLPQGSWSLTDPARTVARRIGAPTARTHRYEIGVSQQEVIDEALAAIADGSAEVVLVIGGEARRYERTAGPEPEPDPGDIRPPDVTVTRPPDFVAPIEIDAGIVWPPVQQYALIDTALAHHEHLSAATHRDQVASLWARFNAVAQHNPDAAFPAPRTADDIATPGPKNRPLAHPYNLWHSSQWTVDQASALLFCSAERAAAAGIPADRWVFPRVALHSSQAITLTARRDLHAWPAMGILGRTAAAHLGLPLHHIPQGEVYSCFPAAVRVQQRELGLDPDGTPTLTGGMSFAGGPFNNFVFLATATMARTLRQQPGDLGLVTTVSGMLSKPGLAVWSCTPPTTAQPLLTADLGHEAAGQTAVLPVVTADQATGPAQVVSYTVTFDPDDPLRANRVAIVADRADGSRAAATCDNASIAHAALTESLIGQTVSLARTTFTL